MNLRTEVKLEGPLFSRTAERTVKHGIREIEQDLANEAVMLVGAELAPGRGVATGTYKRSIHAQRQRLHSEVTTWDNYGKAAWIEGTARTNETTRFKGYAPFRKGQAKLERRSERIAQPATRRLVGRLS